jgi:uncharacterized membrane protein YagU involved in acid resistance
LAAGAIGSLVQNWFFSATAKIAPATPKEVFHPPESEQESEWATQTVARRTIEGLLKRGPIKDKQLAGQIVHYGFGAGWGGIYGLLAASSPAIKRLTGALGFGMSVWMISDNLLLPAFKLSAWPQAYPAKSHAYAIAAHLAFGLVVWSAFMALYRRD